MKLRVEWVDDCDVLQSVDGDVEYSGLFDESTLDTIQEVVDRFEADGITIDQGGDDHVYEFSLPDGPPDDASIPERLLAELTIALSPWKV